MGIAIQISEKFLIPIDTKLSKTTKVAELPLNKKEEFETLYNHLKLGVRFLAVILNGAYTESRNEFLMSLPLFRKLLRADSESGNIVRKTVNDREYKFFVAALYKNRIIEIIEKSQKKCFDYPSGKAGTWRIIDKECLALVSNRSIQSEEIFKYNENTSNEQNSIPGESKIETEFKIY